MLRSRKHSANIVLQFVKSQDPSILVLADVPSVSSNNLPLKQLLEANAKVGLRVKDYDLGFCRILNPKPYTVSLRVAKGLKMF